MVYSCEEIELTLKLAYYAKIHLNEIERNMQRNDKQLYEEDYIFYSHIIHITSIWIDSLFPDEKEIIILRIFENKTYDSISIQVGYLNHSSIIRKYKKILYKIHKCYGI